MRGIYFKDKGIKARAELLHRRLDRSCGHAFPDVGLLDHSRRPSSLLGRVLHFFLPNRHTNLEAVENQWKIDFMRLLSLCLRLSGTRVGVWWVDQKTSQSTQPFT